MSYTVGGEVNTTEVTPDYIYVKPMPELVLDYFLPSNVYGDDAFTQEIEPPVPFSLGVRVRNNGAGVALKSDGTVWAWGYNYYGQVGDGTTTNRSTPVQVSGLGDVISIAAGGDHSVAVSSDGTVWTWGSNSYGQLGDGTTEDRHTPVQVLGIGGTGFLDLNGASPDVPSNPLPSDGQSGVPLSDPEGSKSVTLNWSGGDPDTGDIVTYDVYFGTSPGSLSLVAERISGSTFQVSGIVEGTSYYWQIIAKDNAGQRTSGRVWHFTSWVPDLIVSQIDREPSNEIPDGQDVTFTVTIENAGSGPVLYPFIVDFTLDGSNIGNKGVNQKLGAGETFQLVWHWTALSIGNVFRL